MLSRETGGAYLADLPRASQSLSKVKGATYELRVAREKLVGGGEIRSSDTLRLDFEPEVNFDELTEDDYRAIAERVYDDPDRTAEVRSALQGQPEFDALKLSDGEADIYYEAKNRKTIDPENIEEQATRLFAYYRARAGTEMSDANVVLYASNSNEADTVRSEITQEWLTVVAFEVETPPGSSEIVPIWPSNRQMTGVAV